MVCENCGQVDYIVIDSDKPSYKDPPKEKYHILLINVLITLMNG